MAAKKSLDLRVRVMVPVQSLDFASLTGQYPFPNEKEKPRVYARGFLFFRCFKCSSLAERFGRWMLLILN